MKKSFNRKALLLSLLLLATGSAWAEWEEVSKTDRATFYADKTTIRKDGNLSKMWSVYDLKQRDKDGSMSSRSRHEYDCKGERRRYLATSSHAEPMAGGKTIESYGEDLNKNPWRDIPPGTAAEDMLKIACAQ